MQLAGPQTQHTAAAPPPADAKSIKAPTATYYPQGGPSEAQVATCQALGGVSGGRNVASILQNAHEFRADRSLEALIRVEAIGRDLSMERADFLYRELGQATCAAKTEGRTTQKRVYTAWRAVYRSVGRAPPADSTLDDYWRVLVAVGALVRLTDGKFGKEAVYDVARLVALNGGPEVQRKLAEGRRASAAKRQAWARGGATKPAPEAWPKEDPCKAPSKTGFPGETPVQAADIIELSEMSHEKQYSSSQPLAFSNENNGQSIGGGSSNVSVKKEDLPHAQTPTRRGIEPRPNTQVACQQALEPPVRTTPRVVVTADEPPPLDEAVAAGVMALAARFGAQARARADKEDARPPLAAPPSRPPAAPAPPDGPASPDEIASSIWGFALGDFPKRLEAGHLMWTQLANLKLDATTWEGIGAAMAARSTQVKIRNPEGYIRACAAAAYRERGYK